MHKCVLSSPNNHDASLPYTRKFLLKHPFSEVHSFTVSAEVSFLFFASLEFMLATVTTNLEAIEQIPQRIK